MRLQESQIPRLIGRLGPEFVIDEEGLRAAVRAGRAYQIYFLPLALKIDLFVRGAAAFDRSEFARRVRVHVGERGVLYAASLEDTLLRKLAWFRLVARCRIASGGTCSDLCAQRPPISIVHTSSVGHPSSAYPTCSRAC